MNFKHALQPKAPAKTNDEIDEDDNARESSGKNDEKFSRYFLAEYVKKSERLQGDMKLQMNKYYQRHRSEISHKDFDVETFFEDWPIVECPRFFFLHANKLFADNLDNQTLSTNIRSMGNCIVQIFRFYNE